MSVLVGSTSEGAVADFASQSFTAAWDFVASATGIASRMWIDPKVANAGDSIKVGIYADNGSGLPGVLLGVAGPFTIPAGIGPYSFDISALNISIVSGTVYHLALRDPTTTYNFNGTTVAGAYEERQADFPNPFAGSGGSGSVRLAIWVDDSPDIPPAYSSAGAIDAGTVTSGAAWDPACPAVVNAGEILIAHISCRDLTTNPTTPAGWTLLSGPHATTVGRHWLFGKIADGTEDGTAISFGTQAVTVNRSGRIYSFGGSDYTGQNIVDVVLGFAHGSGTVASVSDTGVTTPIDKCLALNFIKADDNNTIGPFTSETGGDWTEAVVEASNNLGTGWTAQLQIATLMSAGTINGGAVTMSAADPWGVIGCYIRPPIAVVGFLYDTFDGTSGTDLDAHTPNIGSSWSKAVGDGSNYAEIDGGRLEMVGGTEKVFVNNTTPPSANYSVKAPLDFNGDIGASLIGILARCSDDGQTYYRLDLNGFNDTLVLSKKVAGVDAELDTIPYTIADQEIQLQVEGSSIKGFVNGVEVLSATDSAIAGPGKVGIYGYGPSAAGVDGAFMNSILAEDLGGGTPPPETDNFFSFI